MPPWHPALMLGGVGRAARRYGVPLRPPVPPQRHDCPQLSRRGGPVPLPAARAMAGCSRPRREGDVSGGVRPQRAP
ncbi:hypothetical protein DMT42_07565 [Streptomyces actuosus]|uniref:Uncharacterized protein n=1 Tax=Streptomyces actuosus TaxID=1885 RepID=A0A2U9NZ79_STRAS|nr:hypothetical protein DMT42_07565 [Streptomyces actuosus]